MIVYTSYGSSRNSQYKGTVSRAQMAKKAKTTFSHRYRVSAEQAAERREEQKEKRKAKLAKTARLDEAHQAHAMLLHAAQRCHLS